MSMYLSMASSSSSSITSHQIFCLMSPSKLSVVSNHSINSNTITTSLLKPWSNRALKLDNYKDHHHLPRASSSSSQELPGELVEDSKFVLVNPEDPKFGPPALLLVGFETSEAVKMQQLLKELDGEFLEIIFCTEDMIDRTLWEAINTKQSNLEAAKIAKSLPQICFLSGLTGEEMMMFIDAFEESGMDPPIFAALVPNSADKPVRELIEEIMGDHEMMTAGNSD